MPTMIAKSKAIANAEAAAHAWLQPNLAKIAAGETLRVTNTGPMDTFVSNEFAEALVADWKGKGDWNGLNRRASMSSASSADQAVDLKLAQPGAGASCFNYHVLIGVDPAVAEKERKIREQAAISKKNAEAFHKKQADEAVEKKRLLDEAAKKAREDKQKEDRKKQAMVTAYNVAVKKDANLKKADKKTAWEKSWLDKNKNFK